MLTPGESSMNQDDLGIGEEEEEEEVGHLQALTVATLARLAGQAKEQADSSEDEDLR